MADNCSTMSDGQRPGYLTIKTKQKLFDNVYCCSEFQTNIKALIRYALNFFLQEFFGNWEVWEVEGVPQASMMIIDTVYIYEHHINIRILRSVNTTFSWYHFGSEHDWC